jgi:hypothetical protein
MRFEELSTAIRQDVELEDAKLLPSFQRSLRRALLVLVKKGELISLGGGGRADPLRYLDPMLLPFIADVENYCTVLKASEAERSSGKSDDDAIDN